MMTYTKGPWRADRNASFSYSINTDYAHDRGHDCNVVREVRNEANANLIASAPELLNALEEVLFPIDLTWIKDKFERDALHNAIKRAEAVIAKAKGR